MSFSTPPPLSFSDSSTSSFSPSESPSPERTTPENESSRKRRKMADTQKTPTPTPSPHRSHVSDSLDREQLDDFLSNRNFQAPNLESISFAYQKLNYQLHHDIQERTASDPTSLPRVYAFPTGSLMLGIPANGVPCKIVAFGSISPELYHDLVWEAVQRTQEYAQLAAGIYEVQKLPALRFSIHFQGYEFDLQYHQSIPLIRNIPSETASTSILDTSRSFLERHCTTQVKDAILEAQKHHKQWRKFLIKKDLKDTYYLCRALASIKGNLDNTIDARIISRLTQDDNQSSHAHWDSPDFLNCMELESLPKKIWLTALKYHEELPLNEKISANFYLVIDVMHTGCSESQASKWLRHIESRLPKLHEILVEKTYPLVVQSQESAESDRDLHPFLDPSTMQGFNFEAPNWQLNRDAGIKHLKEYNKAIALSRSTFESTAGLDIASMNVEEVQELYHNKCHVLQWPHRLVKRSANAKADTYEGCYVIGLKIPIEETPKLQPALDRWITSIKAHETTLNSKCFMFWDLKSTIDFQNWEETNGYLESCTRVLSRPFMPPPDPLVDLDSPTSKPATKPPKPISSTTAQQPTTKLRPAHDILNRLRHDVQLNIDEYFIGYHDRVLDKIMEIPAQNWIKETTHEAFIPESRIWYFKKRFAGGKEEIMWDRKSKVDKICGSGVGAGVVKEEEE